MCYLSRDLVIVPGYVLPHTIQMTTNQLSDSLASRNQVDMNVEGFTRRWIVGRAFHETNCVNPLKSVT